MKSIFLTLIFLATWSSLLKSFATAHPAHQVKRDSTISSSSHRVSSSSAVPSPSATSSYSVKAFNISDHTSSTATTATTTNTVYTYAITSPAASATTSASDKFVFAHFIAGNAPAVSQQEWANEIKTASSLGIDAFALNIGDVTGMETIVETAYKAAEGTNFKMFLMFDYAAVSTGWDKATVISLINKMKASSAQFFYKGKPLVSTFEGSASANDWVEIKQKTSCFFMPDWSSLGAAKVGTETMIDGALSWDAWPVGASNMVTDDDKAYITALGSKPYMMPVSPWFYTNLPSKNWLWRGDSLWYDRWMQVIDLQPEMVQILTWNDFGESHYIGPIVASEVVDGAGDYVTDMDHTGWQVILAEYIKAYKTNNNNVFSSKDAISFWSKLMPSTSGSAQGTVAHASYQSGTATVAEVSQDKVFATVMVTEDSTFSIKIGDNTASTFAAKKGLNFFSVDMGKKTGVVACSITRGSSSILTVTGKAITDSPKNGNVNFNAYATGKYA